MAYSDFTLDRVIRAFALTLDERNNLFASVPEAVISERLQTTLSENVPLALAINTEKARSELIIMPLLVELRRLTERRISLFSGIDFSVAPEQGLNGVCDFILSQSPEQLMLNSPVLMLVEAKNDNIKSGLGQCIAEMLAAQLFNQQRNSGPTTIHGVVTTGSIWKFLRLEATTVVVDQPEYYLDQVQKVVAILLAIVTGNTGEMA